MSADRESGRVGGGKGGRMQAGRRPAGTAVCGRPRKAAGKRVEQAALLFGEVDEFNRRFGF